MQYDVNGDKRSINYTIAENGSATFNFVSQQGTTTENYTPQQRGGGRDEGRGNGRPASGEQRPPRDKQPDMERGGQRGGGEQGQGQRRGGGQGQDGGGQRGGGQQGGGQQGGGGGDPISRAIDSNGNGILEKSEIQNTAKAILSLDKNKDGKVTREGLRGPSGGRGQGERGQDGGGQRREGGQGQGERPQDDRQRGGGPPEGRRQGNGSSDQAGGPRGPQSSDGPRQPWIVHADEIDLDGDGVRTRAEAVSNSERMFATLDANGDGNISLEEMEASRGKQEGLARNR